MTKPCLALTAALLAVVRRLGRHAGRQRQRHPGRRRRQAPAFHRRSSIGDDGKVRQMIEHPDWSASPMITSIDQRRRPDPAAGADRRARPCDRTRASGAPARRHGHALARGTAAAAARLCGGASRCALDHRAGWNQELWPDKRFPTAADLDAVGRRPAGGAGAGRWSCAGRQQRRNEGRRSDGGRPRRRRRPRSRTACSSTTPRT